MENEIPFTMEAEEQARLQTEEDALDPLLNFRKRASSNSIKPTTEETPLLSRETQNSTTEGAISGAGDDPEARLNKPWLGGAEWEGRPFWKRPSIWWLLPPLLPFSLAFGGMIVPKLNLVLTIICRDYFSDRALENPQFTYLPVVFGKDNGQCQIPEVHSLTAQFQLYYSLVSGILSAMVSPRLGHLSDRYGRRVVLALSAFGVLFGEIFTVIVAARAEDAPVNLLLVGAFVDGLSGSFTSVMALVQSYASDCTPPERRNVTFGYFHGVLFTGIALGPLLAGVIIKQTHTVLNVFYAGVGCLLFFFLTVLFLIPDSVSKERRQVAHEKHRSKRLNKEGSTGWFSIHNLNPVNLLTPLTILFQKDIGTGAASTKVRNNIILLAAIDTAVFGVAMGTMQVIVYYAEYMYGWGNYESSIFVSFANSSRVVTLLVVLPIVTRLVRGPQNGHQPNAGSDMLDIVIIRLSLVFDVIGYIGFATSQTGTGMMLSGVIAAIGGMGSPTVQSSLTKHVSPEHSGQILGAIGLLHALARVVAPTVFNSIYSATVGKFTQAVFVCLGSVFVLALFLSFFVRPNVYLQVSPPPGRSVGNSGTDSGEEEQRISHQALSS
ncbi:hypothetical protein Egran_00191 [Elaphomyces granulatus]|uniref:Major facilitator superfamily (MFS) profile domain-containing protein n=1 Tax=Elaphomyces granulatus TaxID=519963 RepID=A0A232M6T3_9EURO|nr:hypothetical protein Egran_00191 [Elaphomyces granulatus]